MNGFDPIELVWDGRTHAIPANRVMGAVQVYEKAMTAHQMEDISVDIDKIFWQLVTRGMAAIPGTCAHVYGRLLRYAGVSAADSEVFTACREEGWAGELSAKVEDVMREIHLLRLPPKTREQMERLLGGLLEEASEETQAAEEKAAKEPETGNPPDAAEASSTTPSNQPSAANG